MHASERARQALHPQPPAAVARVVPVTPDLASAKPISAKRVIGNTNRLVKIDQEALRTSGLLPPSGQEHEIADQYRAIKRPLIQAAFHATEPSEGPLPKVIMIASALPGEGKTFTGINLALSMAREKDHSVLLVDGDVAKPHISTLFGVEKELGLLDLLSNPELDISSLILPTDIAGLSILPAGTRSSGATELLASERMATVVQQLAALDPGGLVLFDSLPILLTSESRVLSARMGQIVLVVKAGSTPQQAVADAIELIGPKRKISLVLNHAELAGPMGYYYGYRYGYQQSAAAGSQSGG
ncbi:MAG TPA: AAA family ATPase [Steroidobacteraceae bacterium]|nr:AAA family ATPase [Steroidobacteraceae bacterium]